MQNLANKDRKVMLLLFAASLVLYSIYLYPVFLNLNSLLSSITLDSIKNYYTFVYNIRHGGFDFEFKGMNYPFGEHVVYTDCQPLLGFILKLVPPLYPYSIGILHGLLFLSFVMTPLILFRILRIWQLPTIPAFMFSLGLALLSPQFQKINGGHHALAYGCIFPYAILLLLKWYNYNNIRSLFAIFLYNTLIFFIHPYLGFCLCLFTFITMLVSVLITQRRKKLRTYLYLLIAGILPLVVFKVFMFLTDKHAGRPTEPFGAEVLVENIGSLLVPVFGPFQSFFTKIFPAPTEHFEGHSYLGAATLFTSVVFFITLPFIVRKKQFSSDVIALFISALLILFFSFGWHHHLLRFLNITLPELKQFRAVSRFAYVFYFCFPLVLIVLIYRVFNIYSKTFLTTVLSVLFLGLSIWEANDYLKMNASVYWHFPNFFNEKYLNSNDKKGLEFVVNSHSQAIMPLPLFHGGSEMYDRRGSSNSMIPSMIYSYHSALPIVSMMGSRTSITESEELINLLNSYKKENVLRSKLKKENLLIIKTDDELLPDEERLAKKVYFEARQDSITLGEISIAKLFEQKLDNLLYDISDSTTIDKRKVVFVASANRKPFLEANMDDYEKIMTLSPNQLDAGKYVISFHYYYPERNFKWLATDLIITEGENETYRWAQNIPVRILSGFYKGFGVFEYFVDIQPSTRYEFILKGRESKTYHIRNFLLRPANISTKYIQNSITLLNNFPE